VTRYFPVYGHQCTEKRDNSLMAHQFAAIKYQFKIN
jgi:hypothetical protein